MNGFKSEGEKGKVKLEPRVEIWVSMAGQGRGWLGGGCLGCRGDFCGGLDKTK